MNRSRYRGIVVGLLAAMVVFVGPVTGADKEAEGLKTEAVSQGAADAGGNHPARCDWFKDQALRNLPMDSLNSCDVVWDSPSKDSSGSMPLGNGDIGVNAWVEENGDLLFFISKTDAWSDCGRLLKLGQVRIRFDPPLVTASGFSQTLRLREGCIEIRAEGETLKPEDERRLHSVSGFIPHSSFLIRLWVDANRPVIHIEAESQRDMQAQVSLNVWRTKDHDLQQDYSALGVCRGGVPIIEKADVVLPQKDNRIVWYHRNELTIYPLTMQVQGLESLTSMVPDPLLHRTFGGCISGTGFVQAEADDATQALKTAAPTRRFDVAVHVLTAQTETSRQWLEQLNGIVAADSPAGLDKAWAAHCEWWEEFWNRSWIRIHTPEDDMPVTAEQENARRAERAGLQLFGKDSWKDRPDRFPAISGDSAGRVLNAGYSLQRFITAASGRGAYPIKFNGSIFCVNTRNPKSLSEADYRQWGPNYWWQNTRLVYWPMPGSGDYDMMMPLFAMFRSMVPMAEARTRLYYQHDGVFFPETLYPWGAYPNDEYSFARDWGRGGRPAHLLENIYIRWYWQGGIELTAMMLDCYDGTQDKGFLRDTLLPVATGVTTFFDLHWKRDENGKIRFEPACSLEACHSVVNPLPEIAGLRYILPRLCALPADLTTAAQRAAWTKTLADLPEVPLTGDGDKKMLAAAEVIHDRPGDEFPELYAIFPYPLYSVGSADPRIGRRTFDKFAPMPPRNAYPYEGRIGSWRQFPIQAAFVGKADQAAAMIVSLFAAHHAGSRFPAFWGPGHDWMPDQCHGGISMMTLQSMLLQTAGKRIYLFPAWPKAWDVNFRLHAPYKTTVEGEFCKGKVVSLKVTPKSRAADVINLLDSNPDSTQGKE